MWKRDQGAHVDIFLTFTDAGLHSLNHNHVKRSDYCNYPSHYLLPGANWTWTFFSDSPSVHTNTANKVRMDHSQVEEVGTLICMYINTQCMHHVLQACLECNYYLQEGLSIFVASIAGKCSMQFLSCKSSASLIMYCSYLSGVWCWIGFITTK